MDVVFQSAGHRYALDGIPVPSVTQILEPLNRWDHVNPWDLEVARCLGRDVHSAVNLLARGELDWESLDVGIAPYVRAAQNFLRHIGGVVLASEQIVASKRYGCAGTLDLLLYVNGWSYFCDWKVSASVPTTVGAQLAAYEQLYTETFCNDKRLVRAHRLCVRLQPERYSTQQMNRHSGDWNTFLSALNIHKHRERRRYA